MIYRNLTNEFAIIIFQVMNGVNHSVFDLVSSYKIIDILHKRISCSKEIILNSLKKKSPDLLQNNCFFIHITSLPNNLLQNYRATVTSQTHASVHRV
ncbi:hypothetical protein XENTR_v10000662 [Xenopus tropicalis]|nr:hypothetical protein XENTR_v10000662 [Xenopus tropicalis]